MRYLWAPVGLMLLCLAPALAFGAEQGETEALLERIQQSYESLQGFHADFKQRLKNAASKQEEEREGILEFRKPGLVRWETTSPEPETLIVGQDVIWDAFPNEDAVYIYAKDEVLDGRTMIQLLSGQARLDELFLVESMEPDGGRIRLSMLPKEPDPGMVQAVLWVDPERALIGKVLLYDFYFNENEVEFVSFEPKDDLPLERFQYMPEEGVDVFDNRSKGTSEVLEKSLSE